MRITKIGHCCLLIEVKGKRIMTDPGSYSVGDHELSNIDLVLITHEHADHIHIDSLKKIIEESPGITVVTNSAVGKLLQEASIEHTILEGTDTKEILGIFLEAFDAKHAEIFEEIGQVQNTGYFIDELLFYPGDAYTEPEKNIEILALPMGGPWWRLTDALHYALRVAPKYAFPVHDATTREDRIQNVYHLAESILTEQGIFFKKMQRGDTEEF